MQDFEVFLNATPEQKEEMSDAEVFHAAVTIVAQKLHSDGTEILQVNRELGSIPAIWSKRNGEISYVIVSFSRYPNNAQPPQNLAEVKKSLKDEGYDGYWVGVALANEFEIFDPNSEYGMPLMRGFGLFPKISELIPLNEVISE